MRYPSYKFFSTDVSHLMAVGSFANQAFEGGSLMPLEQFIGIYGANPSYALHHVERSAQRDASPEVCGMISFSFLSAATAQALKDGRLDTKDLSGKDQVQAPDVVYLSAIAGDPNDKQARRATILLLLHLFAKFRAEFNDVSFLTKPISESGLNLIENRLGFSPCDANRSGLGYLYERA